MGEEKNNILYVDDEQSNLTAFVGSFRRFYNVYTASNAREGLEIMKTHKIKVVITDQRMPEMTGVQFLEAIIPDYPHSIRIILTGFTDIESIVKAINAGRIFSYINKPWDENELKRNIDTGIKLYDLEVERQRLIEQLHDQVIEQQRILDFFQKFVPKSVVDEVLNKRNEMPLIQGEYRIISVLFSDIRGFTTISSRLTPAQTVELLNDYFGIMSEHIKDHHGSINKFLADGILAIFGAPVSHIDNPSNAVMAGLSMINALEKLNEKYEPLIGQKIVIGIGIHTGEVIAGNIGTADHIEYTVIGDTVNSAQRIEEYTRTMPNTLLISQSTYDVAKDQISAENLGPHELRGREEKMVLYKVLGKKI